MTPEQQVAIDAMRSAWPEESVRAMLAGPAMLDALCGVALEFGRDMDIDERDLFSVVQAALLAAHGRGVYDSQVLGYEPIAREEHDRRENARAALSSSEESDGQSAHRPCEECGADMGGPLEPGETPERLCSVCAGT